MIYMPTVTMSMEEYLALVQGVEMITNAEMPNADLATLAVERKSKRRSNKYSRTYKREFRKIASKYKMKNGKWKKDGFKAAVKAAHRATRKILG
jgi:hypothetical protein